MTNNIQEREKEKEHATKAHLLHIPFYYSEKQPPPNKVSLPNEKNRKYIYTRGSISSKKLVLRISYKVNQILLTEKKKKKKGVI